MAAFILSTSFTLSVFWFKMCSENSPKKIIHTKYKCKTPFILSFLCLTAECKSQPLKKILPQTQGLQVDVNSIYISIHLTVMLLYLQQINHLQANHIYMKGGILDFNVITLYCKIKQRKTFLPTYSYSQQI